MARSCLFCGAAANSKEHAFPSWLNEIVPGEGDLRHGRGDDPETRKTWQGAGFDVQVRQVCAECNQTWMSDLEKRSKPLVTPLIQGTRTTPLSAPEQIKIAAWGYKTGIMLALAHAQDERHVPPEDYAYFMEYRKPPDGTVMWIAGVAPDLGSGGGLQQAAKA